MTYEKKSVIELREIAKERKIKGISTLKKKELIETLEKYLYWMICRSRSSKCFIA